MITNGTYFNAHSYHQNMPLSRGAGSFLFINCVFLLTLQRYGLYQKAVIHLKLT